MGTDPQRSASGWFFAAFRAVQRRRWVLVALLVAGLTVALVGAWGSRDDAPVTLRLGAGHANDEGYALALALAEVVHRHEPGLRIEVVETDGSEDNVRRMAAGGLELITAQADVELPANASLVSVLYRDVYLMLVTADAPYGDVSELAGRRVAVAMAGSGQHRSLDRLLAHHGMTETVTLIHASDAEADVMLQRAEVEAVFRVRSTQNPGLRALVRALEVRILGIAQAEALHLLDPALVPGSVPIGALRGGAPIPPSPVQTVMVERLLAARSDVPADAVEALARVLFERRQVLVRRTPLAAGIHVPERDTILAAPLHDGVLGWLSRDEPSYLERNADSVSLLMSLVLLVGSWVWAARSYLARRMQRRADRHNHVLVEILHAVDAAESEAGILDQKRRLLHILEEVMDDVEEERITPAHFQGFALAWRAAHDALRDRERDLRPQG